MCSGAKEVDRAAEVTGRDYLTRMLMIVDLLRGRPVARPRQGLHLVEHVECPW